jgi:catalase
MSGTLGLVQRYYAGAHVREGVLCFARPARGAVVPDAIYGGPSADPQRYRDPNWMVEAGEVMRTAYEPHQDDDDFIQPRTL